MAAILECELVEEGEALPASIVWSLRPGGHPGVLDVLVTLKLPRGKVEISTAFYRSDIASFADEAAALAKTLAGEPHIPGYEPVDSFMLYVVDAENGTIGASGQFHSYFLYDKGQAPYKEVADSLGPFCLKVEFQAMFASRASVTRFARDLAGCAREC